MESTSTQPASTTPATASHASERVLEVLKASVDDAEALLKEAATATGDRAAELRERALKSLRATRETLHETQDIVLEQGRRYEVEPGTPAFRVMDFERAEGELVRKDGGGRKGEREGGCEKAFHGMSFLFRKAGAAAAARSG